ncbi:MAG: hypothetical protein M3P96_10415 [Actinomycetota bacterium]|nr:hypothetical protein [Actinomycetota bacterium]
MPRHRRGPAASHGYDGWLLATRAIDEVGTDKEKVRNWLENAKNVVGISGVFTMTPQDHSGLSKDALVYVTVAGGSFKLYSPPKS